ncbi:hypothetical protein BDA99DRAFT_493787 [Phascolomyces articulosus]|uniref:Uncharacterized protein n=1 Tax=Phascolomyces articulosus TaxID=60185 RepID=A0AAD5KAE1_9FUNG|nr:hypothetical protein BDA99DRAFT_493787 [Phascolomyces articulosus]
MVCSWLLIFTFISFLWSRLFLSKVVVGNSTNSEASSHHLVKRNSWVFCYVIDI